MTFDILLHQFVLLAAFALMMLGAALRCSAVHRWLFGFCGFVTKQYSLLGVGIFSITVFVNGLSIVCGRMDFKYGMLRGKGGLPGSFYTLTN